MNIVKHNRQLTYISLERSVHAATDEALQAIGNYCRQLKTLSLAHCILFTDHGLSAISSGCKKLKELSLAHCYDLSSSALSELASKCSMLVILTLECETGLHDTYDHPL